MKIYTLESSCPLPVKIHEAWNFFSSPFNLSKITPPGLQFRIISNLPENKIYNGQIICYEIKPIAGITMSWITEICHINEPFYFVDEQRFGPYSFWHHKHFFVETTDGVIAKDIVHYAIPYGIFGRLLHYLFIRQKLEAIFQFREKKLQQLFGKT
jgi:ligand-binding SRPBCC domain-containing protein